MTKHARRPLTPLLLSCAAGAALALTGIGQAAAQMPPYTASGMGLHRGQVVVASVGDIECGRAHVPDAGNWKISIGPDAPCRPVDSATIHFEVDGVKHAATARWSGGGAPVNPRTGIALGPAPRPLRHLPPQRSLGPPLRRPRSRSR